MKTRNLLAFILPLVMAACSESKDLVSSEKGSLYISSTVTDVEIFTRTEADVNQFTLFLEHESNSDANITGLFSEFPNGAIEDIAVGNYALTLTSHPDGFVPAFDNPWYQGLKSTVPVASGKTTLVSVECTQANAGITFTYDSSLETSGLSDIVPEMRQGETTLYFEGENREGKAYFMPGEVELRIKHGDKYLMIGGKESQTLTVSKEQLWQTTLKASQITGSLGIVATVKVITEPTNFIEFELGESDPVAVEVLEIGSYTASFLVKGDNVEAVKFGIFAKASVDFMLALPGVTLESIINGDNGTAISAAYLVQLNSSEGLVMNFEGMDPETEYCFLLMATKNSMSGVQRYEFITSEGIKVDPDQDPDGPIVPGSYVLNIYQEENSGEYIDPYENEISILKATQDNVYIVNNLFLIGDLDLIAEYDDSTRELTFTGKDLLGYDIFNDVVFDFNDGEYWAGIYLTDGTNQVDKLVFNVIDRKLSDVPVVMELRLFDPFSGDDLGWLEISPLNNPFIYGVGTKNKNVWNDVRLLRESTKKSKQSTRSGSYSTKGKKAVYASVSELR